MINETSELLNSAIIKMRVKNIQKSEPIKTILVPEDAHKGLFPILEIFNKETQDPDINDKAKFIYDFLTDEQGTARDKIMSILNELPPISNEPTINRIYKYCRLRDERNKLIKRTEIINQRIRQV